jgi:hypothetical protein
MSYFKIYGRQRTGTNYIYIYILMSYFKIYGKQRTGTNYISSVLLDNFIDVKVFMNVGGWKHGNFIVIPNKINLVNSVDITTKNEIDIDQTIDLFKNNKVNFIVIIKNPYMWVHSICKYYNKPIQNELFVIEQIKIWNEIYSEYKQYIENGKAYLVKYEILLQEPNKVLEDLIKKFDLKRKNEKLFILEKYKMDRNADINIRNHTNELFDKTKYINPNIDRFLPKNIIKIINNNIDFKLMSFYNYDTYNIFTNNK